VGASSVDRYALLGVDLLLQRSGAIKIVEVNTMPNFIHSPQIIRDVNVPLFADILARVVLDVERPGLMPISG
jgi:D-alanine-D-alanine ligase-like ATP-grasp enzyme